MTIFHFQFQMKSFKLLLNKLLAGSEQIRICFPISLKVIYRNRNHYQNVNCFDLVFYWGSLLYRSSILVGLNFDVNYFIVTVFFLIGLNFEVNCFGLAVFWLVQSLKCTALSLKSFNWTNIDLYFFSVTRVWLVKALKLWWSYFIATMFWLV